MSALATRSALVLEEPPEKTSQLLVTFFKPNSSTSRQVASSLLNWELKSDPVGMTKSISPLSIPASPIAMRADSNAKLMAPWSG